MPMATIEVTMPGPTTAASMMAESTAGKAKVKSEKRMMISSVRPRLAEAIRPRQTPKVRPMLTAMMPTMMVERAPASSSETMSRPKTSVRASARPRAAGALTRCRSHRATRASTAATAAPRRAPAGSARRRARSCDDAARGARRSGPAEGAPWPAPRRGWSAARSQIVDLDAGIDEGIEHVDHEIDDDDHGREQHHAVAHHDEVAVGNRLEDQAAEAG